MTVEVEVLLGRARARLRALTEVRDALGALRVEGLSADGRARVVVDGDARPVGIEVRELPGDIPGRHGIVAARERAVVEAAALAATGARARRAELLGELADLVAGGA